jgi:hypothetical protein
MSNKSGNDVQDRAIDSLTVIVDSIRRHPTASQTKILVGLVAGLYNGPEYPFDLTTLRELDLPLSQACLNLVAYNCVRTGDEIHEWGVFDDRQLLRWIEREGIASRAVS